MSYIQVSFQTGDVDIQAILIAILSQNGFEGFEEQADKLQAFIPAAEYSQAFIDGLVTQYNINYEKNPVPEQNWNAVWEDNFSPVIIDDFCSILAHFHNQEVETKYVIHITPKMSFGTGHHATTRLMVKGMGGIDINNKSVFDFGTGTGVLAILASQLGASEVLAIDNDEWAYTNAIDNVKANDVRNVEIRQSILDEVEDDKRFDVILANINRYILLQYMQQLKSKLNEKGALLMSGLLTDDAGIIVDTAKAAGLELVQRSDDSGWIALLFRHV